MYTPSTGKNRNASMLKLFLSRSPRHVKLTRNAHVAEVGQMSDIPTNRPSGCPRSPDSTNFPEADLH
jgi:hypothetical protein